MTQHPPAPFIVGVARSGTTLLRLMLDAHPQLAIGPESHFVPEAIERATQWARPREDFVRLVASSGRWPDFGLSQDALRQAVDGLAEFTLGDGLRCFYQLYAARFGKPRWGDKTPPYVLAMPAIVSVLPEARFVHLIRDGRDAALSVRGLWFGPDNIRDAAAWWQDRIRRARTMAARVEHYLELRFEDVVTQPEPQLHRVCEFLDLPWSERMLSYHEHARERLSEMDHPVQNARGEWASGEQRLEMHSLALQEPQRDRAYAWKTAMSRDECMEFQAIAGETLKELGYELW